MSTSLTSQNDFDITINSTTNPAPHRTALDQQIQNGLDKLKKGNYLTDKQLQSHISNRRKTTQLHNFVN